MTKAAMSERKVICGMHPVSQLLADAPERVACVYLQEDLGPKRLGRIREILDASGARVERVHARQLAELTGNAKHQGVAASIRQAEPLDQSAACDLLETLENPLVLVLDSVQDPRNLGSVLRTANAAGADLVAYGRSRTVGITPVVSKVAAGAAEVQAVAEVANLARFLSAIRELGVRVVGTDADAAGSLFDANLAGPLALVLGAEGHGIRRLTRDCCDELVSLPMAGSVASLNVSVAAGISLYEAVRQRNLAPPGGVK